MYARPRREPHQSAPARARGALRAVWAVRALMALLLLPTLLSGGAARAQAMLRCEVTQQVHATCCCPATPVAPVASISRSCCCTRVAVDQALPSGSVRAATEAAPPLLAALLPGWRGFGSLPALELLPDAVSPQQAPPPPIPSRPSLIVLHRRFLI